MSNRILQLMEGIRRGGDDAHEAALTLGLLLEREKVNRSRGQDGGVNVILGPELADWKLSSAEQKLAVDELIKYIGATEAPEPMVVWALTKSYEPRMVNHLIALVDRLLSKPGSDGVVSEALGGIITIGLARDKAASLEAIQRVAHQGHGEAQTSATQYLKLFVNHIPDESQTDD